MLILILIDVQYSQNAVFSFESSKSLLLRLSTPGKKISAPPPPPAKSPMKCKLSHELIERCPPDAFH